MKYILLLFAFWAGTLSAQDTPIPNTFYTNYVVISNENCDDTEFQAERYNTITIVNTVLTITPQGGTTQVFRVHLIGQDWDGTYYYEMWEYGKGYVYINPLVQYVTIVTEHGCIDYFNR